MSWEISELEKQDVTSELFSPYQLCPNITDFKLGRDGKTLKDISNFVVQIQLTPRGLAYDGTHVIYHTDIARDFNPDQYLKDGFEKFNSLSEGITAINSVGSVDVLKWISQTKTNYYSSAWLFFLPYLSQAAAW